MMIAKTNSGQFHSPARSRLPFVDFLKNLNEKEFSVSMLRLIFIAD